jgi:hypothetical protein
VQGVNGVRWVGNLADRDANTLDQFIVGERTVFDVDFLTGTPVVAIWRVVSQVVQRAGRFAIVFVRISRTPLVFGAVVVTTIEDIFVTFLELVG